MDSFPPIPAAPSGTLLFGTEFDGNANGNVHPKLERFPSDFLRWGSDCGFNLEALAPTVTDDLSPSASSSHSHQVGQELADLPDFPEFPLEAKRDAVKKPAAKRPRRRGYQLPASTRQKNRAAQQRFRQRQKLRQQNIVSELDSLREENAQLQSQVVVLEEQIKLLRTQF